MATLIAIDLVSLTENSCEKFAFRTYYNFDTGILTGELIVEGHVFKKFIDDTLYWDDDTKVYPNKASVLRIINGGAWDKTGLYFHETVYTCDDEATA